jgi:hypothetical protein
MNASQFSSRYLKFSRKSCASGYQHGIVTTAKISPSNVLTDLNPNPKANSLGFKLSEPAIDVVLFHLEVGYAIAKKASDTIISLKNSNGMPRACKLLRRGKSGRT